MRHLGKLIFETLTISSVTGSFQNLAVQAQCSARYSYHKPTSWDVSAAAKSPMQSLSNELKNAQGGDEIVLSDGVYRKPSRITKLGLTIVSQNNHKALIQVSHNDQKVPVTIWVSAQAECMYLEGLTIQGILLRHWYRG